ncbi:1-acylglycerol-3-phosphate O-acyltransferase [Saitozyma podzolica]|uniref:1-acyl-sn-glycerol-3-phosphate acyltransferase n=1 Tax=Saitozyma podzolica TaxID=1890683 RepID=A0A427YEI0_9TREE|nr:1-acylglycerol-3-phosphate O-acyltransferase [Saitozyma podzolica]
MEHLSSLATAREGKGQSAVLLGNHQSFLDILYLGRIFPKRAAIMAKRELQWSPLLGQYLTLSGAVMVDRKNRKNAVAALEKAGDDMKKKGLSLWIFPEGTRSSSAEPKLLPFKKGAFHLAVQAQVPIVPVVCENYHRLFDGRTRMERGRLRIKVLPPIPTVGLTADDVHSLAESTQELMLQTLISISTPGPSQLRDSPPTVEDHKASISAPPQDPTTGERQLRNREGNSSDGSSGVGASHVGETGSGGQLGSSVSAGSTTEDEMDEDAVLLKKPKAE